MHFQTWSDVAGNAPPLTAVDPVTGCYGEVSRFGGGERALRQGPDHARAMSVPKSKPSHCFDHSANEHARRRQGCSRIPHRHGAFHRPIAGVFCVHDPTRTRRRQRDARAKLSRANATLTIEPKSASGRTRNATARRLMGFGQELWHATIFLFRQDGFR